MDENKNKKRKFQQRPKKFTSEVSKKVKIYSESVSNNYDVWNVYMPSNFSQEDVLLRNKIKIVENYFSTFSKETLFDVEEHRRFIADLNDISKDENFSLSWPDFQRDLENTPEIVLGLFGLGMDNIIQKSNTSKIFEDVVQQNPFRKIHPRIIGFNNVLPFQHVNVSKYGKFVTLIGSVIRATDVKPYCIQMAFSCLKCRTIQFCSQEKGCFTSPNRCIGQKCFSTSFKALLNSPLTVTVPWQIIRLQELSIFQEKSGHVPHTIECELLYDLADSCSPGDIIMISGTVGIDSIQALKRTTSLEASAFLLSIIGNSVICLKGRNSNPITPDDELYFQNGDASIIKQIHSSKNIFERVVASLCPKIYGHELVKAGIILALFSGDDSSVRNNSHWKSCTRVNSHILIVGDPGIGKSQMLLASADVSPRGVYVCGNATTKSGLTVTITKGGGDVTLEAGALVLSDQGHCCIDEFDKMKGQHSALMEAMEQQTISMAKSGVVCVLPARTSVIAAANPSGGHYNKAKTVSENLKLKGSLLSRFDIVFILQDRPDKTFDSKMAHHMMSFPVDQTSIHNSELDISSSNNTLKLIDSSECISRKVLQKYISYARKFSHPKLTPEVGMVLQSFYVDLRKMHKHNNGVPITTRQFESMIRLTVAKARVELRSHCTLNDAEFVIEIMKHSMVDTFSDEYGNIDFNRSIHGSGMSKHSQAKKFVNVLTKTAINKDDDCFTESEMKTLLGKAKIPLNLFSDLLESLNEQGFLLKKGYKLYKIQTL